MNRVRQAFPLLSVLVLALVFSVFAFSRFTPAVTAQNTATIEGVITDLRDAPVSDATITLQTVPSSPANHSTARTSTN